MSLGTGLKTQPPAASAFRRNFGLVNPVVMHGMLWMERDSRGYLSDTCHA